MKSKFSPIELQTKEWLKKAYDDELNANSILTHRDGTATGVCLLSQQMAEKYLKAFLVFKKQWFPRIHALDKLAEVCSEIDKSFGGLKDDASFLNVFYTPARYPADFPEFFWPDAEKAFSAAKRIKKFVLSKIELE
ncbi:MAG: HEPN domain-containing protein [Parcubacteria group bacterium]|nr:HEPN domain-containing protein [Parcubacteria group bacterium]